MGQLVLVVLEDEHLLLIIILRLREEKFLLRRSGLLLYHELLRLGLTETKSWLIGLLGSRELRKVELFLKLYIIGFHDTPYYGLEVQVVIGAHGSHGVHQRSEHLVGLVEVFALEN